MWHSINWSFVETEPAVGWYLHGKYHLIDDDGPINQFIQEKPRENPPSSTLQKGSIPDGSLAVVRCLWNEQSICRCFSEWRGWVETGLQEAPSIPRGYYNKSISRWQPRIPDSAGASCRGGMLHEARLAWGTPRHSEPGAGINVIFKNSNKDHGYLGIGSFNHFGQN